MANVDRPFGLVPVGHLHGAKWTDSLQMRLFDASNAVYIGDPVKSGGSAGAAGVTVNGIDCEGMPTADRAAAGDTLLGVVVAFLPKQSDLSVLHKEATSTKRIGLVVTSPDTIYEIQEDSVGNDIAVTQVGNNFDMVTWLAGNSTTGISAIELDSSDTTGTGSAQFRLIRLSSTRDNVLGSNAKWIVVINEHEYKTTTGV
jgi:hypothetical protein